MGRLDALVVAALGRSPYDEDIVSPDKRARGQSATQATQLYDEKGRPSNPEAKQYMKDQIRASNEIMQVAGVAVEKDDLYLKDEDEAGNLPIDNFQRGYFRLGFGRMLLSDSVWGVTGLRRRILLYRSYDRSIIDVLRHAYTKDSIRLITGAGLPAFIGTQFGSYLNRVIRMNIRYGLPEDNIFRHFTTHLPRTLFELLDFTVSIPMTQLRMFAILQQSGLISTDRWLPSLRSFIPFTVYSPIQPPSQFTLPALFQSMGSVIIVYLYGQIHNNVNIYIEDQVSHVVPRAFSWSMPKEPGPLDDYNDYSRDATGEPEEQNMQDETTLRETDGEAETEESPVVEVVPVHNTAIPAVRRKRYDKMTILTVMPAMLASEHLSTWLGSLILLPLELLMVNVVGRAYRRSAGLSTSDIGWAWGNIGNALVVHMGELVLTGLCGAGYTAVVTSFGI